MVDSNFEFLDFENTEKAFSYKTDKELKRTKMLFTMMNSNLLVNVGSSLTNLALKLRIPLVKTLIKATIFKQFVGGENLEAAIPVIKLLSQNDVNTILDYGAEAKSSEEELDRVVEENIDSIRFASTQASVPIVVSKITALADNDLLTNMQSDKALTSDEEVQKTKLINRLDKICKSAYDQGVSIMIDAEESWLQDSIDDLCYNMMEQFNKRKVVVFNTYQLYRHDKLEDLKSAYEIAKERKYILGAKLVRGAYMDKENNYAMDNGLKSVIQSSKDNTDIDYNKALQFCISHYKSIGSVCASHNSKSNYLQAHLIEKMAIDKRHPHLNFCQLYGMSDNLTFNLASAGYNVAKYLPYGSVHDVIPYLIRRAMENTAVTQDVSRELKFVKKEMRRRNLSS